MGIYDMRMAFVRNSVLGDVWLERLILNKDGSFLVVLKPNVASPYLDCLEHPSFVHFSDSTRVSNPNGYLHMLFDLEGWLALPMTRDFENVLIPKIPHYKTTAEKSADRPSWIEQKLIQGSRLDINIVRLVVRLYEGSSKPSQLIAALKDLNLWPEEYSDTKLTIDLLGGYRFLVDSKPGHLSDLLMRIITLSRG